MKPDNDGLARNSTAAATSSTSPARGNGVRTEISPIPGVGITSGATQFTRIKRPPSSNARLWVRLATAAFMAPYTAYPGAAR